MPVVDGFSHHNHGGEGEVVVVHDFCQVFQLSPVNTLVGPGEVVASRHWRVGRIFLHQLFLHIVHDGGAEKDAHGALALGEQMDFLALWHRCAAFSSGEDDGLTFFRNGELAFQFGCSCEER